MKPLQRFAVLILAAVTAAGASLAQARGPDGARGPGDIGELISQWKQRHGQPEFVYEGASTLSQDRAIKHYTWVTRVGDGPYDKIRVHRYVREPHNPLARALRPAPDRRKVLFIINGTWGQEGPEPIEAFDSYFFPALRRRAGGRAAAQCRGAAERAAAGRLQHR